MKSNIRMKSEGGVTLYLEGVTCEMVSDSENRKIILYGIEITRCHWQKDAEDNELCRRVCQGYVNGLCIFGSRPNGSVAIDCDSLRLVLDDDKAVLKVIGNENDKEG